MSCVKRKEKTRVDINVDEYVKCNCWQSERSL